MKNQYSIDGLVDKFATACNDLFNLTTLRNPESFYERYNLPVCILDAIFSMSVKYESTKNVVKRYCNYFNISENSDKDTPEHTLQDFINNIKNTKGEHEDCVVNFARNIIKNTQRTSTKNGILKAEAAKRMAEILYSYGINTMSDWKNHIQDIEEREKIDNEIKSIKGQKSGIMLKYFYMNTGNTDLCKPDRMIHRFVRNVLGVKLNDNEVQYLMLKTCEKYSSINPDLNVRLLDNTIWKYQRNK